MSMQSMIIKQEVKLSRVVCPYGGFESMVCQNSGNVFSYELKVRFILMGNYSTF